MEYQDEKIAMLKKQSRKINNLNIKNDGVYVNDKFIRFQVTELFDGITIYLPEDFIDMPEEVKMMKYPSKNQPQIIKTSLSSTVNFAFNLFAMKMNQGDVGEHIAQLKGTIKNMNPSFRFLEERQDALGENGLIKMFDFISYGIDEQIYNMMCLIPLSCGTLHAIFNCLIRDSEEWKEIAWQALLTLKENDVK